MSHCDKATGSLVVGLCAISAFALIGGLIAAAVDIAKRMGWL